MQASHFTPNPIHPKDYFLEPCNAKHLLTNWSLGAPLPRSLSLYHLNQIAQGTDHRSTDFLKQCIAEGRISSASLNCNRIMGFKGCTLLCSAVESGYIGRVDTFLAHGAHPNACQGLETPLHTAVRNNDFFITKLLLDGRNGRKQADIHAQNVLRETPLHLAVKAPAKAEQVKICQILIAKGASPKVRDEDGKTPLDLAEELEDSPTKEQLCHLLRNAEAAQSLRTRLQRWFYAFKNYWSGWIRTRC